MVTRLTDEAELRRFCEDIALIEYNASGIVYYDIQLFAFICCCHRISKYFGGCVEE